MHFSTFKNVTILFFIYTSFLSFISFFFFFIKFIKFTYGTNLIVYFTNKCTISTDVNVFPLQRINIRWIRFVYFITNIDLMHILANPEYLTENTSISSRGYYQMFNDKKKSISEFLYKQKKKINFIWKIIKC